MPHILIVEDEIQIREVLRTVLERVGYKVSEATDGNQGLKRYAEGGIDLVVTDIIMPNKGGIDFIMDLRRDYHDVKIIAISSHGYVGEVTYLDMAIGVGANRAMGKPFVLDDFLQTVEDLTTTANTKKEVAIEKR